MSKNEKFENWTYAKIAAFFISAVPTCRLHYGFDPNEHRYVLMVEGTGLYLRDVRGYITDNIELKYGNTQDTIIIIDTTDI